MPVIIGIAVLLAVAAVWFGPYLIAYITHGGLSEGWHEHRARIDEFNRRGPL